MTTRYRRQQTTPLERINSSVTGARAFRITLGIKLADLLAGLLETLASVVIALALLAGYVYGLWLLIESLNK